MPVIGVYISSAEPIDRLAYRIGPHFPPSRDPFSGELKWWANGLRRPRIQLDVGEYAYLVSKADILNFIEVCYGDDPNYTDPSQMATWQGVPYLKNQLDDVRAFCRGLSDAGAYGLVWSEI